MLPFVTLAKRQHVDRNPILRDFNMEYIKEDGVGEDIDTPDETWSAACWPPQACLIGGMTGGEAIVFKVLQTRINLGNGSTELV